MIVTHQHVGTCQNSNKDFYFCKVNQFDDDTLERLRQNLSYAIQARQSYFPVLISSMGGSVYHMLGMIDMIKQSPLKVCTVIEGMAISCGAFLATMGHKGCRYVNSNATMMYHVIRGGSHGLGPFLKTQGDHYEQLNDKIFNLMETNSLVPDGSFRNAVRTVEGGDLYVTPERAVQMGLMDYVGVPSFTVRTTTEVILS